MGRAADGSRTRDLHHGKVALYQLSYCRMRASFEEHAGKHYPIPGVPHAGPAPGERGRCTGTIPGPLELSGIDSG